MALKEFYTGLREISIERHKKEDSWFTINQPIKEFSIEREGELIHYGVWNFAEDEDFLVMFKFPNGKYSFSNRLTFDKKLIKELSKLLEQ